MVGGEAGERTLPQPIQPAVADMHHMCQPAAQDERGEGAGHGFERRIDVALGVDPGVHRFDRGDGVVLDAPHGIEAGVGVEEPTHRQFRRDSAAFGASDPIGEGGGDAASWHCVAGRAQGGGEILVGGAASEVGL